ncbi:MAG TPA: uroporphyrinogen-III C-methyltransferase [Steroidobacteraceae bacterium]|nr:uroporphyrinogen-III C-methyltransferase [Steroidobacteraceae bacterium]
MSDLSEAPVTAAAGEIDDRRSAERRRGEQRRVQRALWQGALGLLLGVIAIALAALAVWRIVGIERALERNRSADQLANRDLDVIRTGIAKLEAQATANSATLGRLEPLPHQLELLGLRVGTIEDRIEAPQRAVARVEAAYLVELADRRLALERDVAGAVRLYEAAAARLASLTDATSLRIRAQLERDLALLRSVPEPDVSQIGARLAAAGAVVRELPMLGMIKSQYAPPGEPAAPTPGLARAWQQFTTSLHELVTIRRVSDATVELVSMEEIGVRRDHLETLLFAARLAALRGDDADYAASVAAARDWLARFFDLHDPHGSALEAELAALAGSRVSPEIPDVSGSLKLLRRVAK